MDRISELPKEIKHHIVNLLPEEDAPRTSVLSKSWKLLWDSRPLLVFSQDKHRGRIRFDDFLDKSLQRFAGKGIFVEELSLCVNLLPSPETIAAVSRWVSFAAGTNLRVLKLRAIKARFNHSSSKTLLHALSSSGTLTTLRLSGFELALTTPRRSWKLPRLQSLSLADTTLDSAALEDLVSSCPSLEQLELFQPSGMKNGLELSRIGNLKRVMVELSNDLRKISMPRATSLESFTCAGKFYHYSDQSLAEIELSGCEASLKELQISSINLSSEWVESKISQFRNLKVLALEDVNIEGRATLKISSTELTQLFLKDLQSLASDPEIYAPNLRKLEISGHLVDSLVISQSLESVNFGFCVTKDTNKYLLYDKLQYFFYKIKHMNNVVVCFVCLEPMIAIVHEGHSDNLLDTLCDLYDSMSRIKVIILSGRNWDQHLVKYYQPNRIYVASSPDNNNNHLSEYLVKELTSGRRNRDDNFGSRYVESIAIETEEDKPAFGDDVDSQYALLKVYRESSFKLTRFALQWSPSRSSA